jgi:hypothetical protein
MDDERLVQLRKFKGETDDAFIKRFGLTASDFERWKRLTNSGTINAGPEAM